MSRGSLAIAVLTALTACKQPKGVQVDGRALIPARATIAFGFEVGPLRGSPVGPMLYGLMVNDAEMRRMAEAVQSCDLDLDKLRGVLAMDPARAEHFFLYVEGPKIGDTDTVRCMEKTAAKAIGAKDGRLVFDARGDVLTLAQEGGGQLLILNENAIAVVDVGWQHSVFEAIEKPESRNGTGVLAKVIATLDPSSDMWLAIALDDGDRAKWSHLEGSDGIVAISGTADLAQGMKVTAHIDARDAANAKQLEAAIREVLEAMKPGIDGLPPDLVDTARVSTADARVTGTLEINADSVPQMVGAIVAAGTRE